jgi:hypothetical protein
MSGIVGQQIMGEARFDIQRHPADLIKQPAGILITAGTEDQKTHAGPYWRGSLFNAVLLHGLRGAADRPPSDGVITSQELFAYLESAVSNESHQTQTPHSVGSYVNFNRGERVWVTGKVKESNWYQVELDTGVAYIFSRLLEPVTTTSAAPSRATGISQPPPRIRKSMGWQRYGPGGQFCSQ